MTTRKIATTPEAFAKATPAIKAEILTDLRDTQGLSWWRVSEALNLGGRSKATGKHFGQPARAAYSRYVRPHVESNPHGQRGRPRKSAPTTATPAKKAPAKRTTKKSTAGDEKAAPAKATRKRATKRATKAVKAAS